MAKKKKQADHRADTRGKPLSGLPHVVADSEAYLSLTAFERAVLGEILRKFNGYNNGSIAVSYEQMGDRVKGRNTCRPNNGRIGRAVAKLVEHGLLTEPTPASWLQRRAREYRLTFISSGKGPPFSTATNEYLSWRAPKDKNEGNVASPRAPLTGDRQSPGDGLPGKRQSSAELKIRSFASAATRTAGDVESLLIDKPYPHASDSSGRPLLRAPRLGK